MKENLLTAPRVLTAVLAPVVIRQAAMALAGCAVLFAPALANARSKHPPATNLTLINGWTNGAFGAANASVSTVSGIVRFHGAISSGTDPEVFVLPAAFRPGSTVYVKVDLCNAHNGRLEIDPNGATFVEVENNDFAQAQCFTSLDGATFAMASDTFKQIKLKHGWKPYGGGTADPAADNLGTIHLAGAMATSKNNTAAFTLKAKFRPTSNVFVPVDLCDATNGRLNIDPSGVVSVQAETDFSNAQCFTSLDGVTFATTSNGFTALSLINGWTNAPFGTRNAAVRVDSDVVHFEGAIATTGSNQVPFVLPSAFRPAKPVWIPVDLCDGTNGRLAIATDGTVTVEAETDFANAQCFTSLEGAVFHL
ncbi:MAG TPA: hypothetical protein VHU18_12870 [Rhizomicrobium sp.]|nr:hypothetical protein [Rhizomicrobium sp.]